MTMKRKRAVAVISIILVVLLVGSLVFSALGSAFAVSQAEIDALRRQRTNVAEQRQGIRSQIDQIQDEMENTLAHKVILDEQNALTLQEIELINQQIDLYDMLIAQKALELEEALRVEQAQREALRVRMREMEESRNISYIAILFRASSFTDLLARIDFISTIMQHDRNLEEAYIAAREHVEAVKAEYQAVRAQQEIVREELLQAQAILEQQIAEAEQLLIRLEADVERFRAEFEANQAQEAALNAQINEMVAELERQMRQQQQQGGSNVTGTGTFRWPLPGFSAAGNFGWRVHPIFGDNRFHAGEDIAAPTGTPILAADSGTVAIATFSSSFGNYVVISHGNGISTLYAHMSRMSVSAGQSVSQGQVIGYVGSTGWSTGPHLHFEVRVNGNPVAPLSFSFF